MCGMVRGPRIMSLGENSVGQETLPPLRPQRAGPQAQLLGRRTSVQ